jgi:hypothetical protein
MTQSFVTSRLDIVGNNLLVTRPVTSAPSFSLAYSFSLPLVLILPGTPSDYLEALALGGSTYGESVPATRLATSASCFSSFFAFATSPFSLLSPPETVSLYFVSFPFLYLSLSSASFTMLIGTILRRHFLPYRLQCYQLLVAPLLKTPLTLS